MLGRIVELSGVELQGFEVIDGIVMDEGGMKRFGFGTIIPTGVYLERTRLTYIYSSYYEKEPNVYIVSTDYNPTEKPNPEIDEEFLWVIIPYSSGIETNAKKVAGRYPTEGIFEMYVGETIEVRKAGIIPETYMVAKAGNELFLVKKNR